MWNGRRTRCSPEIESRIRACMAAIWGVVSKGITGGYYDGALPWRVGRTREPVASGWSADAVYNRDVSSQSTVRKLAEADFPTRWGHFRIMGFEGHFGDDGQKDDGQRNDRRVEEAVALVMGDLHATPPLVRIHSQCLTGDVFGSLRCDCRQQLEMALSMIAQAGAGVLVYEQQEGRGIGLMAKLQAYELQDKGLDTVQPNEQLAFKPHHREFRSK